MRAGVQSACNVARAFAWARAGARLAFMRVGATVRSACSGVRACNGVQVCVSGRAPAFRCRRAPGARHGARLARMRGRKDDMAGMAPNNPSESTSRFQGLVLRGARNVRDLGGYPFVAEGGQTGTTAHGAFLRGDALGGLRSQDFARLDRYGLSRVIDVRSSFEVRHWPDPYAPGRRGARQNVEYIHIPMLDQLNSSGLRGQVPRRMSDVYLQLLDNDAESFRLVMEALDGPGCALFHCRAGKDRTGVIAMLLLGIAGVDDAQIVADYAATGEYMSFSMHAQRVFVAVVLRRRVPRSLFVAQPVEMERTLSHLHERYGTARAYLQDYAGCEPALLDRLVARLRGSDEALAAAR